MYPCHYPGCTETFENHTFLMSHILRDHGNGRLLAWVAIVTLALVLLFGWPLTAVQAQTSPLPQPTPSISEPPNMLHVVYLPLVASGQDAKAAVSWCPTCRY